MGTWHVSKTDGKISIFENLKQHQLDDIEIPHLETKALAVTNERDVSGFCDNCEQYTRVTVRAEFAGCGKPHVCKTTENRRHKALFVCHTNKFVRNSLDNGVTLNFLFGIGMTDDATKKQVNSTIVATTLLSLTKSSLRASGC